MQVSRFKNGENTFDLLNLKHGETNRLLDKSYQFVTVYKDKDKAEPKDKGFKAYNTLYDLIKQKVNSLEACNFLFIQSLYDPLIKVPSIWSPLSMEEVDILCSHFQSSKQLVLKNKIIKLKAPFELLNNEAIKLELNVSMSGESTLWVFSRCLDSLQSSAAVCYISKEYDSFRKFINFGRLEEKMDKDYLSVKQCRKHEIPKNDSSANTVDMSNFKLTIYEDCDSIFTVKIECWKYLDVDNNQKTFTFKFSEFPAFFKKSNFFLGADGDIISVQNYKLNFVQKEEFYKIKTKQAEGKSTGQACKCCVIF